MSIKYGTLPDSLTPAAEFNKIGRPKGSIGKRSLHAKELAESMGVDPLAYLLSVVKNRRKPDQVRVDAAKAACVYLYPRLSTVFVSGKVEKDVNVTQIQVLAMKDPELAAAMEMLSLALSAQQRTAALQSPAPDPGQVIDLPAVPGAPMPSLPCPTAP